MTRKKSYSHRVTEALSRRMGLNQDGQRYLLAMDDGYNGELDLDSLMKEHLDSGIVLKDVNLHTPLGDCQIDTMVIKGDWIFVHECKNFFGEYTYGNATLTRRSSHHTEFENPEMQLNRHCTRLKSLLTKHRLSFKIAKTVVYINPSMTMFNAPEKNDFLMRSQIELYLKKVAALPNYPTHNHARLLQVLSDNERDDIRFDSIPTYSYIDLKKGLYCSGCGSLSITLSRNVGSCNDCNKTDKIAEMLNRNIEEFRLLFPETKLKPAIIGEWCGGEFNRARIHRALKANLEV